MWCVGRLTSGSQNREGPQDLGLYLSCLWTAADHGLCLERTTRAVTCLPKQLGVLRSKGVKRGTFECSKEGEKLGMEPGCPLPSECPNHSILRSRAKTREADIAFPPSTPSQRLPERGCNPSVNSLHDSLLGFLC